MKWLNLQDNINLLSIIGAGTLLILTSAVVLMYVKQMKIKKPEPKNTILEDWDGIKEEGNELPVGWAVMFILAILWALWYFLLGFPLNSFSQVGMYNDEVREYNAKFESKFNNPSQDTLMAMGQGIYLVQCSQCHGIGSDGINGKSADLTVWGSEQSIIEVILKGSKGMNYPLGEMPAGMADEVGAKAIAAFMAKEISAIKSTKNENLVEEGRALWGICASCHGEDGKGLEGQSPDLSKYGSADFVADVLSRGKHGDIGQMPAFKDGRLSEVQKYAVGEYIISLSKD